jgi:DHA1 family bicyclomycin/chloramphenicol resistance-like MFS transporter
MLRPDTFALTALLALLTALGPVSTDMYLPSMPDIGRLFGATAAEVQLTLSLYLIGFAVGHIIYGPVSDRYGRKPVLMAALTLYCAATLACAFAPSIKALILARGLQALGGSGASVLARAIVRDLYTGARAGRELSLMGTIMALAPIIAPIIGGALQTVLGWRAIFVAALAFALLAIALVWRALPETLRQRAPEPISLRNMLRVYRMIAENRAFLAHLGIVAASYGGLFAWLSGSSFVLQDLYGLSAFEFGIAFAICSLGYMLGTAIAARIVTRIGLDQTIGLGALALAAGGLAMVVCLALGLNSVASIVLATALYLAGLGLVLPQAMAGALTPFPDRAGAASSLVGFVMQTSAAILGAVVGQALGQTAWPLAIPIALMGTTALLLWAATRGLRAPTSLR